MKKTTVRPVSPKPQQDPRKRPTVARLLTTGVAVGMAAGALFATLDLVGHRATISAAEAERIVLFVSLVATCLAVPIALAVSGLYRWVRPMPAEHLLVGALSGLAAQLVLLGTLSTRKALFALPIPWLIAWGICRGYARGEPRRVLWRGTAMVLFAACMVPTLLGLGLRFGGNVSIFLTTAVVAALAYLVQRIAVRHPLTLLIPLLCLAGAIQTFGSHSPGWHVQPAASQETAVETGGDKKKPNIVLIVLDTTRRDHLGCYGHDKGLTPVVDRLASQGVVYEDMIAASSWTVPSHASLFTGYYPLTHGCSTGVHRWLDDGFVTLAEMLSGIGYQTTALVANGYLTQTHLLQGFETYIEVWAKLRGTAFYDLAIRAGVPARWSDHGSGEGCSELAYWLDHYQDGHRPFFLFVNLMEGHWPLHPPFSWRKKFLPPGVSYVRTAGMAYQYYGPKWMAGQKHSKRHADTVRRMYEAAVAYQDQQLGRMLDIIRSRVDLDRTVVIVTADHGENFGEKGRWGHSFAINDTLIHVPLIVRYPPRFPAGLRIQGQCQNVDIVPTIFDLLNHPCPVKDVQGRSLVPEHFLPREYAFAQVFPYYGQLERMAAVTGFQRDITEFLAELRTVRTNQYQYVWSSRGHHSLYDVRNDPREETNLIEDKPDVAAALQKKLADWWSSQPHYVRRAETTGSAIDKDALERLKSLGYVGD